MRLIAVFIHRTSAWAPIAFTIFITQSVRLHAQPPAWSGEGTYRLVVEVEPVRLSGRAADELPAEVEIRFASELQKLGVSGTPNLSSLQVMRIDPQTGRPLSYRDYRYARREYDRPFRWYDGAIPYEFPEFHGDIRRTRGKIVRRNLPRRGHYLNVIGEWQRGRLAWAHSQRGDRPSRYAIYFDLLPPGEQPSQTPPRGWLGDGLSRCDERGATTTGCDHCRIDLDDWDGDGLVDIVLGENYGHLLWWRNVGTSRQPKYTVARLVYDADGLPVDAGITCAPKVVDWDGDGLKDLLAGTGRNRIIYYRNVGTDRDRKLSYVGPLEVGGKTLELPVKPVANASARIFKLDYYPVLETADWDGDGDLDLLAGGGITGRVFFYETAGRHDDGTPRLILRGPVEADGEPLNVQHWFAAPCAADFDGDGDLDLVAGAMPMHTRTQDRIRNEHFLRYFENVGSRTSPGLRQRPFPRHGQFPRIKIATPRAADWDDDGDLDLVVSNRHNLYLFENTGTRSKPDFAVHDRPLPSRWGSAPLPAPQFLDWNGDGRPDFMQTYGYRVNLNSGQGNPWSWSETITVLPAGQFIDHPHQHGDRWFRPRLDDFDSDGRIDVLFGDWFGHVWFHRNLSTADRKHFDTRGVQLKLSNGIPVKVGPIGKDPTKDFDALQGARTELTAADFDRDGLRDLVVGDTYGKIRYFRNLGPKASPAFAEPVEVGDLGIRLKVAASDWNGDGWPDVLAGAANGRASVFLSTPTDDGIQFGPGVDLKLPPAIIQPRVAVVDLNCDGDDDLFLPSTLGSCFVERSFLKYGYARGKVLTIERKPQP